MPIRHARFIAHKGRIFVFICLYLYITLVSGLPYRKYLGQDKIQRDRKGLQRRNFVYTQNIQRYLDRNTRVSSHTLQGSEENAEYEQAGKIIQEVKLVHKLDYIGNPTSYRHTTKKFRTYHVFHAFSQNGRALSKDISDSVKFTTESPGGEIAFAQQISARDTDVESDSNSSPNMVVTIASVLVGLFSMSVLVAIFQCCCKKQNQDDSTEQKGVKEKTTNDKSVDKQDAEPEKDTEEEEKTKEEEIKQRESVVEDPVSFRNRIKAFEKTKTPEPTPVTKGPTPKKRPQSEAFKAFENKGILIGMGRSPLLPRKKLGNEDENSNETPVVTPIKSEGGETTDKKATENKESKQESKDDMAGYVQPENPDVVIADVDEDDTEFGAIKRETEVLRSYRKAPPPKNRNRSSAAFRRKKAQESMADLINEGKELSFRVTTETEKSEAKSLEKKSEEKSTELNSKAASKDSTQSENICAKSYEKDKSPFRKSPEKTVIKNISPEKDSKSKSDITDSINKVEDLSAKSDKTNSESLFVPGGNIFLQIDPTVQKKSLTPKPLSPHGGSHPDIRIGARSGDDIRSTSPVTPDGRLVQALTEKLKTQKGNSDLKQNKLYNRRSLNTDL